jgi:protein SCO1/2
MKLKIELKRNIRIFYPYKFIKSLFTCISYACSLTFNFFNHKSINLLLVIIFSQFLFINCSEDFEIIEDLSKTNFSLLNQDSLHTNFPSLIEGKVGIVGYIFTNCPDICPLTTNNMRLIREKLVKEDIKNVEFVSITFDPEVDNPSVLKNFSQIHDVNFSNWEFLTGEKSVIENLMKEVGVVAFVSDSIKMVDSSYTYIYVHTDRIQLIDEEGRIRKNYLGSVINIDEVVNDVKLLVN